MKLIVSAIYSDNLGDGVLALSAEHLMEKIPGVSVAHLDISGRNGWTAEVDESGSEVVAKSGLVKRIFYRLPSVARYLATLVAWFLIFKPRLRRQIDQVAEKGIDHVVIAGGQLISDIYWNFPLKLSFIVSWAERNNIRVSFLAVGVSSDFSPIGRKLFAKALTSDVVNTVGVRDQLSLTNLEGNFDVSGVLVPDAGLWSKDCFGSDVSASTVVGLGISSPEELGLHASLGVSSPTYKAFWHEVVGLLTSKGYSVALFSNGSADDEGYKNSFFSELIHSESGRGLVTNVKRPLVPQELCSIIASFNGIISHRLHANIIANSYCIPSVGLKWDKKLESYFQLLGQEGLCLDMTSPAAVVEALEQAMAVPVDIESIDHLKNQTLSQVELIAKGQI